MVPNLYDLEHLEFHKFFTILLPTPDTSLSPLGQTASMKALLLTALIAASSFQSPAAEPAQSLDALAKRAISPDATTAIEQLRAAGPAGLEALFNRYGHRIQIQLTGLATKDPAWEKIRTAFDTVAQQRDAFASHLYWYTNLNEAEAAAHAAGKPILSLRLLGNLNEEYSCANSRFFRTTLYPNAEVSRYLRDHFVLHWQSVRPIPRITIDMGDGRRIERTITGNSIHYILDADGHPIDALPGLYGAKDFIAGLDHAFTAEQAAAKLTGAERENFLANYHSARLDQIIHQWGADLEKVNQTAINTWARESLDALTSDAVWQKIAALHSDGSVLDWSASRLIQFKQPPTAMAAGLLAGSKAVVETPVLRMMRNLQHSIAEDTVHNEYQMHTRILEWFVAGTAPKNITALNNKIYADIFLTPSSDPWLGLAPANAYSALDNAGLIQTRNP